MEEFNEEMREELAGLIRLQFKATGRIIPENGEAVDICHSAYSVKHMVSALNRLIELYKSLSPEEEDPMTLVKNPYDGPRGKN